MMQRLPQWDRALSDYLAPRMEAATFVWGQSDCALFAADAIIAMTGTDIAAPFRGRYCTAIGSARALSRYGAGTLSATFDTLLPERPVGFARRGDVVMHDGAVGVCIGAVGLFMPLPDATPCLVRVPRHQWSRAWGV